jgi:hypothetical protein
MVKHRRRIVQLRHICYYRAVLAAGAGLEFDILLTTTAA